MPLRKSDISRVVGLSTEESPTSQSRTENPRIRNLEVDQGGVATTRDGYERLASEAFTDSSIRLRGAPYHATLWHEFRDAILIPYHEDYRPTGDEEFTLAGIIEFTPLPNTIADGSSPLTITNDYGIISRGTTTASGTITITAFAQLNAGDKVNLIATDGTNYDFVNGAQSSVNGTWESTVDNDQTATNLMNVINTSSGPAGTRFTATVYGAVVTVTQAVGGTSGDTTITLTDSGVAGMTKTDFTNIRGTPLEISLYLEYASTNWTWHLHMVSGAPAVVDLTVVDSALDDGEEIGKKRYFEIAFDGDDTVVLTILNAVGGSSIGTATSTAFSDGLYNSTNDYPWVIGTTPETDGFPPSIPFQVGGSDSQGWLSARVAEIRIAAGSDAKAIRSANVTNGNYDRELRPYEYGTASVIGYWKLNDGIYGQLLDSCDLANKDYLAAGGLRSGNDANLLNIAPQWVTDVNDIRVNVSQNPDIASNYTGASMVGKFGLHFGGLDGMAIYRSLDPGGFVSTTANPLSRIWALATPAAGVGWTAELVFTPLLEPGETTYPNRVLYASSDQTHGSSVDTTLNPIMFSVVSDQFELKFVQGASVVTITITADQVSDFAGEKVTLTASRNYNTLSFAAYGENKSAQGTNASLAGSVPAVIISLQAGPFVMIGRKVNAFETNSATPATFTARAANMIFHEFRLWATPTSFATAQSRANIPVPEDARQGLAVYLVPTEGSGNEIENLGTSIDFSFAFLVPPFTAFNITTEPKNGESFIYPAEDTGPLPDRGIVTTYRPVKATGMIDFRRNIGETVARQLMIAAGSSLWSFDLSTNTLKFETGGIFKTDRLTDMIVFDDKVYLTNGGRPRVWDGSGMRFAGIAAPQSRPVLTVDTSGSITNSITDAPYLVAYRFANSKAAVYSNLSPWAVYEPSGSNDGRITNMSNIEVPPDPQVDAIEIFATPSGDSSVLYRLSGENGRLFDLSAGTVNFNTHSGAYITALTIASGALDEFRPAPITVTNFDSDPATVGDFYRFTPPPPSVALGLMGTRIIYALRDEPTTCVFSRIDGSIQPEHINMTPGFSARLKIPVDSGDQISAIRQYRDSLVVYLRDGRAEFVASGLEPTTAGFETPIEINILDHDIGSVSPYGVVNAAHTHITLAEGDLWTLTITEIHNLSSPPEEAHGPSRPHVGRTIRGLDGDFLKNAVLMHRQERQQIWIACTESTGVTNAPSSQNDTILVYSYRQRKWTSYRMPYVDMMIEVEASGDRRRPIGCVSGFVCQLDVTGRSIDSSDSSFLNGATSTVNTAVDGQTVRLASNTHTESTLRFRPMWIGTGGKYYLYIITDNRTVSARDELTMIPIDGQTPVVSDDVHIGSICPMIDFNVMPLGSDIIKRIRRVAMTSTEGGNTAIEINAWWDEFGLEPAYGDRNISGQTVTTTAVRQYVAVPLNGSFRIGRIQLVAPGVTTKLNIAELIIEYEAHRGRMQVMT